MIKNSFIFLDGIGTKKEQNIWNQGIICWDDFIKSERVKGVSRHIKGYYDRKLMNASNKLTDNEVGWIKRNMPQNQCWRLYNYFKDEVVFLDIETTGLSRYDQILMVGMYDGNETKILLKNANLEPQYLKDYLKQFKLIVTFNGASFDIPFLERKYPGVIPEIPHMDLMHVCSSMGYKGGLKNIEKLFNIHRKEVITDLDGGDVYRLWKMGMHDEYYLNLLIEYNEEDVINLKKLADLVVKQMEYKIKTHLNCKYALPP